MENIYEITDNLGREYFLQRFSKLKAEPLPPTDKCDIQFTGKTGVGQVEIKVRNMPSTRYKDYEIDFGKIRHMYALQRYSGYTTYYCNFFDDGKVLLWKITKELIDNSDKREVVTPRKTCDPSLGKITKTACYLKKEDAYIYDYDNKRDNKREDS